MTIIVHFVSNDMSLTGARLGILQWVFAEASYGALQALPSEIFKAYIHVFRLLCTLPGFHVNGLSVMNSYRLWTIINSLLLADY